MTKRIFTLSATITNYNKNITKHKLFVGDTVASVVKPYVEFATYDPSMEFEVDEGEEAFYICGEYDNEWFYKDLKQNTRLVEVEKILLADFDSPGDKEIDIIFQFVEV